MAVTIEQQRALALARARLRSQAVSGITPAAKVKARLATQLPNALDRPDPTAGMGGGELAIAGFQRGLVELGRGAGQALGFPGAPSPEEVDEQRRLDAPLMRHGPAKAGQFAAQVLPSIPLLPLTGVGGGAAAGAITGALQPVGTGDSRMANTVIGGVVGAAVPAALKGGAMVAKTGGRIARDTVDAITPGGPARIATRKQREWVGDEARAKVVEALRGAKELVPGSKPTAAQAVAHLPEGSPIIAHQKQVASMPGGLSAKFGQRKLEQKAAREAEKEATDTATGPMRQAALTGANQGGGVKMDALDAAIDNLQKTPGLRASDVVSKTLANVREKLDGLARVDGTIDAEDLYMVRKELGSFIQRNAKESANFDKKLASSLQRDLQKGMDDAIEQAGGAGWKGYLAEYAKRSKAIEDDVARAIMAVRPPQATRLTDGKLLDDGPNLLSRPAMIVNFIRRKLGADIEPRVNAVFAERYLDPQKLADALEDSPLTGPEKAKVAKALLARTLRPPVTGGAASLATGDY